MNFNKLLDQLFFIILTQIRSTHVHQFKIQHMEYPWHIKYVLGDKSKKKDFLDHINNIDFIFLTETRCNTKIYIPDFRAFVSDKKLLLNLSLKPNSLN
jgi:hypothetical protein